MHQQRERERERERNGFCYPLCGNMMLVAGVFFFQLDSLAIILKYADFQLFGKSKWAEPRSGGGGLFHLFRKYCFQNALSCTVLCHNLFALK